MAGILSARAPPTNAYSHNYRPSFPRNFHIQSIDHTAELQRTVITLSRDNKELNDRNEQLRRQLMDIGTKVRPYQPRRRGPEDGGRPPTIPNFPTSPSFRGTSGTITIDAVEQGLATSRVSL
jgi:hypothetical protein